MKTTVELPDELVIAAKQRAVELRTPLRALIERGLRNELATGLYRRDREARKRIAIRWVIADGGAPEGVDRADRESMHHDLLRRD